MGSTRGVINLDELVLRTSWSTYTKLTDNYLSRGCGLGLGCRRRGDQIHHHQNKCHEQGKRAGWYALKSSEHFNFSLIVGHLLGPYVVGCLSFEMSETEAYTGAL